MVANRRNSTSGKINLPAEIVQVTQIVGGAKDKALVLGMVNGSVFDVVVINTSSIAIVAGNAPSVPGFSPATYEKRRQAARIKAGVLGLKALAKTSFD